IAALFKADRTGMVMTLIRIGLMVGSVYVVILMFLRNNLQEGLKWFLWVVVATNLLFLPKTTVWIDDPLMKTKEKVDHVPFALGFFAGFVSQMGRAITEKVESVFTLPDYMPYHQTGTVFASSLMSQVGQFRITDPVFKGNMERFINQCVVYDAMIGHKYTLTDLQNQNDIWTLVSSKASPVLGFLYKDGNNPGEVITCKAGAQKLNTLWKTEIEKATAVYGSRVQNQKLTKTLFFSHLHNGYQLLSGISKSAEDILKQEMMINAIEEASNNKLSELGATSNYAATKALLQQRSAYATAGEIAARTLPLFKNVIEALSYALFIFIVVLALLPNGYRILMTYCGILVWTQLWAPLYAVLNLIMTLYGTSETKSVIGEGLTLLNSAAIINRNADMTTLAAWLSVSIPFISYGILKQGAAAFVGIAQHLGSAMESAASGAAAETVSGNVSLGNFTMGTQVYQNTSAFQHSTNPSYNSSQFRSMGPSGVEQSTFADGTQAFNDQAMSRLSVQIMGTENTSYAEQESFNNAWSVAQSQNVAATEATEASLQHATNFFSQLGTDRFKGEDYSKNISASEAKSLQNFKHFTNTLQKDLHLNEAQAVEVALGVGIGGGLKFLSAEGKGNFSSTAARQKAFQDAKAIADQIGYSENTERVITAAKALSEGSRDSKGAGLGENASASLNKAKGLREEASIAQSKVNTLSKEKSSSESKAITISKELTQEVLEFISHQPANPGPDGVSGGQIGYKEARRILEHGGGERAAYLKRFQEENPQYSIQSINVHGAQQKLDMQYETQAQAHRNSADIQAQNASHVQSVHQHAKDTGFDKPRIEQTFSNPKESENSQQQKSSNKQPTSQSSGQSITGGSTPLVQDNVQIQPKQSTDNASIQVQTPPCAQSAQLEGREAGLGEENPDKFHSRNVSLHQAYSDQAPLHSKQDTNLPQENAAKQAAPQSNGQSINGGSTSPVQDNVQIQPQQSADNASIQSQTPTRVQSAQPEERDAGLDEGNAEKFHSRNTSLHQTHSDQAFLHSKQIENLSQENTAKQAAPQPSGQNIRGGAIPSSINTSNEPQTQHHSNNSGAQAQDTSNVQKGQQQARDTRFDKEHLEQNFFNPKEWKNSQQQEDFVKQIVPQPSGQSINGEGTPPFVNTPSEPQSQSQPSNAGDQVQHPFNDHMVQQHFQEDIPDKTKVENPQQESIKDFVEKKFKKTDKKIGEGRKSISGQEKILQKEHAAVQDKTLLGTATKNLVTSTGEGLLSVGKDINEAIKNLPPEPPIIFP
ncbi:MAG: conjugal transfer protein TraG N-terminal domain-containing protein, partial [Alphaproteobacteria bacterium]|nr:conjugal transfer protein TraG N-terminal domain-containing protein [Alphaproteobacteria bacterium]